MNRGVKNLLTAYLPIFAGGYKDVNAPDLVLSKRRRLEVFPLLLARIQNDPLLSIDHILRLLTRQHPYNPQSVSLPPITLTGRKKKLTFNRLTTPSTHNPIHRIRHLPILIPHLHKPLRHLRRRPRRLQHIRPAPRHRRIGARAHHKRFGRHGCEPVDVRPEMDLDDVVFCEGLGRCGVGSALGMRDAGKGRVSVSVK